MIIRALFLTCLLLATSLYAQEPAPVFASHEVVPGIHAVYGAGDTFVGGNVSVMVGDEYVLLIDDALVPTSPALIAAVNEIAGRPIDFVINTHYHGDHTGGNAQLAQDGTIVVAHDNLRKRLAEKPEDAGGAGGIPVITFSDTVTFHLNGQTAYLFHLPNAHTDGDGAVHFPEVNVIHAGDVLFNGIFPYVDLDGGGSIDGFIAAQQRLIAMSDDHTIILSGHGDPVANKADVERDVAVLIDSRARVKALVDAGKSLDEVLAENPLAEYHDDYNWGFITTEKMTTTLYRSLTTE
ncbi:MAG: MBL fold metallo-hydrolase [Woeseiaceae bacterium]|nr:MBL fold metallo-hydrolase [Woeseiaceae bacterium]